MEQVLQSKSLIRQVLYVDYAGGKFVSWFYSEGQRFWMAERWEYSELKKWAISQDFTDVVLTNEAAMFLLEEKLK